MDICKKTRVGEKNHCAKIQKQQAQKLKNVLQRANRRWCMKSHQQAITGSLYPLCKISENYTACLRLLGCWRMLLGTLSTYLLPLSTYGWIYISSSHFINSASSLESLWLHVSEGPSGPAGSGASCHSPADCKAFWGKCDIELYKINWKIECLISGILLRRQKEVHVFSFVFPLEAECYQTLQEAPRSLWQRACCCNEPALESYCEAMDLTVLLSFSIVHV